MNILVVSDLHAYMKAGPDKRRPSIMCGSPPTDGAYADIMAKIPETLAKERLTVDWLICPGDIADQADPDAQRFAWAALNEIKQKTGARLLLATVGNHDVDSRLNHSEFDPKGILQSLVPSFPGVDDAAADRFWSRNYHIHTEGSIRVVNLNSAAFHGYQSEGDGAKLKKEYLHGRVSNRTIENIVRDVSAEEFAFNILLTHHHPVKNENLWEKDYSEMALGTVLLEKLCAATNSAWFVLHGHQHYPDLSYGKGKVHFPVVMSAGSVAATIEAPYSSDAPNQFYLMSLETDDSILRKWGPCGQVRSWHWHMRREWEPSPMEHRIPYGMGFGCRRPPDELAAAIAIEVLKQANTYISWTDLVAKIPELKFVVKESYESVVKLLPEHGIKFTRAFKFNESELRKI